MSVTWITYRLCPDWLILFFSFLFFFNKAPSVACTWQYQWTFYERSKETRQIKFYLIRCSVKLVYFSTLIRQIAYIDILKKNQAILFLVNKTVQNMSLIKKNWISEYDLFQYKAQLKNHTYIKKYIYIYINFCLDSSDNQPIRTLIVIIWNED